MHSSSIQALEAIVFTEYPTLIATAYRQYASEKEPDRRLQLLTHASYEIMKLLALLIASEYFHRRRFLLHKSHTETTKSEISTLDSEYDQNLLLSFWQLDKPAYSTWISIINAALKHRDKIGFSFIQKPLWEAMRYLRDKRVNVPQTFRPKAPADNVSVMDIFRIVRNYFSHYEYDMKKMEEPVREGLKVLEGHLIDVLLKLEPLRSYEFYRIESEGPEVGNFQLVLYRGEGGQRVQMQLEPSKAEVARQAVVFVRNSAEEILPIFPFFVPDFFKEPEAFHQSDVLWSYGECPRLEGKYALEYRSPKGYFRLVAKQNSLRIYRQAYQGRLEEKEIEATEEREILYQAYQAISHIFDDLKEALKYKEIKDEDSFKKYFPLYVSRCTQDTLNALVGTRYLPEVYYEREELMKGLRGFVEQEREVKRLMVIVGESGSGKSSLLSHFVLQVLERPASEDDARWMVLMVDGKRLGDAAKVMEAVARLLNISSPYNSWGALQNTLSQRIRGRLLIVLDAINEAPNWRKLLSDVFEVVSQMRRSEDTIRFIVSIRSEAFRLWKQSPDNMSLWKNTQGLLYEGKGEEGLWVIPPFTEAEAEQVYALYQEKWEKAACQTPWQELPPDIKKLLQHPLHLHLWMQLYQGQPYTPTQEAEVDPELLLYVQYLQKEYEHEVLKRGMEEMIRYMVRKGRRQLSDEEFGELEQSYRRQHGKEFPLEPLLAAGLVVVTQDGLGERQYRFAHQRLHEVALYLWLKQLGDSPQTLSPVLQAPTTPELESALFHLLREWWLRFVSAGESPESSPEAKAALDKLATLLAFHEGGKVSVQLKEAFVELITEVILPTDEKAIKAFSQLEDPPVSLKQFSQVLQAIIDKGLAYSGLLEIVFTAYERLWSAERYGAFLLLLPAVNKILRTPPEEEVQRIQYELWRGRWAHIAIELNQSIQHYKEAIQLAEKLYKGFSKKLDRKIPLDPREIQIVYLLLTLHREIAEVYYIWGGPFDQLYHLKKGLKLANKLEALLRTSSADARALSALRHTILTIKMDIVEAQELTYFLDMSKSKRLMEEVEKALSELEDQERETVEYGTVELRLRLTEIYHYAVQKKYDEARQALHRLGVATLNLGNRLSHPSIMTGIAKHISIWIRSYTGELEGIRDQILHILDPLLRDIIEDSHSKIIVALHSLLHLIIDLVEYNLHKKGDDEYEDTNKMIFLNMMEKSYHTQYVLYYLVAFSKINMFDIIHMLFAPKSIQKDKIMEAILEETLSHNSKIRIEKVLGQSSIMHHIFYTQAAVVRLSAPLFALKAVRHARGFLPPRKGARRWLFYRVGLFTYFVIMLLTMGAYIYWATKANLYILPLYSLLHTVLSFIIYIFSLILRDRSLTFPFLIRHVLYQMMNIVSSIIAGIFVGSLLVIFIYALILLIAILLIYFVISKLYKLFRK